MNEFKYDFGDGFQQKSKYFRDKLPSHALDWSRRPKTYKTYPDAVKKIKLLDPKFEGSIQFWNVIKNRHSTRRFT